MREYLKETYNLLMKRCDPSDGKAKKEPGVFLVVTCLRSKGGILNGSGSPRIFQHINIQEENIEKQAEVRGVEQVWKVLRHDKLESDVHAAGDNNRTYDVLLFQPCTDI